MAIMQRIKKPTTRRGKKALVAKEPKAIEGPKQCIFLHGRNPSEITRNAMKDIYSLKKPDAAYLSRKNDIVPFDDATLIEKMCYKKEAALFAVGSHNKKRPHNLLLGRTFNYQVLDMVELGLAQYTALSQFRNAKVLAGVKPCLVFSGAWDLSESLRRLRSLLTDFFHREQVETVRLQGLEHVLSFTLTDETTVLLRSYRIALKKSGQRTPRIELESIGPSMELRLRRSRLAAADLWREACRVPRETRVVPRKNISKDALGTTRGTVHVGRQDVRRLQTRKMKGLRKTPQEKKEMRLRNKTKRRAATHSQ